MIERCPFCELDRSLIVLADDCAVAMWDRFPVSDGHLLIITRRHVADWFDSTDAEKQSIFRLLDSGRQALLERYAPSGFNIGVNVGTTAGQTIGHVHVHLIPRYEGDVREPRVGWICGLGDTALTWTVLVGDCSGKPNFPPGKPAGL